MTEQQTQPPKRPLFRPEAVEHHAKARIASGKGLDLRERRTTWLFRGLLVAMVLAVLAAFSVHVDRSVAAPAVVDSSGRVAFGLPGNLTDSLRVGQDVTLLLDGRELRGTLRQWEQPEDAQNGALVAVADVPGAPAGERGRVVLRLGRQSVAEQLLGRS